MEKKWAEITILIDGNIKYFMFGERIKYFLKKIELILID
jgi:hypothetical protein